MFQTKVKTIYDVDCNFEHAQSFAGKIKIKKLLQKKDIYRIEIPLKV